MSLTIAAPSATERPDGTADAERRERLYEVDMLRVVTALAVVGVHVVSFTVPLNHSTGGVQAQDAVVAMLHFTREIFLAITTLVLVYQYMDRPFSARAFWRKRGMGVLLPYVIWSLLYSWLNRSHRPLAGWLGRTLLDILTGNASFQLYFILLAIQIYLVLPALLWLLARMRQHPWRLLVVSFAVEVVALFIDFRWVQAGPLAGTRLAGLINGLQMRYLPLYQLYVVLGAVAALHIAQLRGFVLRHRGWVIAAGIGGMAVYLGHYLIAVRLQGRSVDYETSVFQPTMALYATTTALALFGLSAAWAARRRRDGPPPGSRVWGLLSAASFGVYLVHPLFLTPVLAYIAPALPVNWPVAARVFLIWLIVAGGSVLASIALLRIPLLRFLVGRPRRQRPEGRPSESPERNRTAASSSPRRGRMRHGSTAARGTGGGK